MKNWSAYQSAIFDHKSSSKNHLVVTARAGSGKSTVLEHAASLNDDEMAVMLVFNRRNAVELKRRLFSRGSYHVTATTLHSYGYGLLQREWGEGLMPSKSGQRFLSILEGLMPKSRSADAKKYKYDILKASQYARCFHDASNPRVVRRAFMKTGAVSKFVLPKEASWKKGMTLDEAVLLCARAIQKTLEPSQIIDYEDMVYVPYALDFAVDSYGSVFLDECQDFSEVNANMGLRFAKAGARLMCVGDPRQSINSFVGADSKSVSRLKRTLEADELGMPITYRCASDIVSHIKKMVPDFEARPEAPQGVVRSIPSADLLSQVRGGDMVVSRKKAPLASIAVSLLKSGVPAFIVGGEDGTSDPTGVQKLVEYYDRTGSSTKEMMATVRSISEKEIQRLSDEKEDDQASIVRDRMNTILALSEGADSVSSVVSRIKEINRQKENAVVLSTVHRAKGAEAPRVFSLEKEYYVNRRDLEGELEEQNIHYVGLSRAAEELVLVQG